MKAIWILPFLGALAGGGFLVLTAFTANGAPQEAAGATIACALGVLPYVFARAIQEFLK